MTRTLAKNSSATHILCNYMVSLLSHSCKAKKKKRYYLQTIKMAERFICMSPFLGAHSSGKIFNIRIFAHTNCCEALKYDI